MQLAAIQARKAAEEEQQQLQMQNGTQQLKGTRADQLRSSVRDEFTLPSSGLDDDDVPEVRAAPYVPGVGFAGCAERGALPDELHHVPRVGFAKCAGGRALLGELHHVPGAEVAHVQVIRGAIGLCSVVGAAQRARGRGCLSVCQ